MLCTCHAMHLPCYALAMLCICHAMHLPCYAVIMSNYSMLTSSMAYNKKRGRLKPTL